MEYGASLASNTIRKPKFPVNSLFSGKSHKTEPRASPSRDARPNLTESLSRRTFLVSGKTANPRKHARDYSEMGDVSERQGSVAEAVTAMKFEQSLANNSIIR